MDFTLVFLWSGDCQTSTRSTGRPHCTSPLCCLLLILSHWLPSYCRNLEGGAVHLHPILTLWLGERGGRLGCLLYLPAKNSPGLQEAFSLFWVLRLAKRAWQRGNSEKLQVFCGSDPNFGFINLMPKPLLYQCLAIRFRSSYETPRNILKKLKAYHLLQDRSLTFLTDVFKSLTGLNLRVTTLVTTKNLAFFRSWGWKG